MPNPATYRVKSGDSLFRIAAKHGVDLQELQRLNDIVNPNAIRIGQVLKLSVEATPVPAPNPGPTSRSSGTAGAPPQARSYTVRSGDSLSAIANRLGTTVDALMRENGIRDANRLSVGQVLKIPGGTAAPAASAGTGAAESEWGSIGEDWAALIEKHGDPEAKADFAGGKRIVIALRKPTNTKANQGRGVYDDQMIVVHKANGALKVAKFRCNTEPSRQYGAGGARHDTGPDLNADGKVDQGRLVAGTYHYEPKPGGFLGGDAFRVRSNQTAERDINQDGDFNAADGPRRIDPSSAGTTMYIHRGGDDNTWSAGCQTIQKSRYNAFLSSLGGQKSFSYILIDLNN